MAQAIVDHQTEFLNKGPEHIEPLKMQQIADKVGVHVTTVSRAVDDKWIQTPRGIFPLKRFFVGGTVSADGEEVAWDAVRLKLQEIVDHENKQHPFSDDELVKELAKPRPDRRPAHGDQVSQGDGHSQFAAAARLGAGGRRKTVAPRMSTPLTMHISPMKKSTITVFPSMRRVHPNRRWPKAGSPSRMPTEITMPCITIWTRSPYRAAPRAFSFSGGSYRARSGSRR